MVIYKPLEVIVVDNNSSDDSISAIRSKFSRVKIVANTTNKGFSGGNNDGIAVSRGKYVLILNNDTEVQKDFLEPLVTLMEKDTSVGCTQPKLVYGDKRDLLNAVGSYLTSTGFLYHYGYRKNTSLSQYNKQMTIYSAKGAAMFLRRSAVGHIGNFDEDFFIYFEETDLCHRLWLAGYKVIYEPTSVIYHYEAIDTHKQMKNSAIMYLSYRNRIASFMKNLSLGSFLRIMAVIFPVYIFLIFVYLGQLQWRTALAVVRAVGWNIVKIPGMLRKRAFIQRSLRRVSDTELFGTIWRDPPLVYYYYLFRGLQYFRHEPSLVEKNSI